MNVSPVGEPVPSAEPDIAAKSGGHWFGAAPSKVRATRDDERTSNNRIGRNADDFERYDRWNGRHDRPKIEHHRDSTELDAKPSTRVLFERGR